MSTLSFKGSKVKFSPESYPAWEIDHFPHSVQLCKHYRVQGRRAFQIINHRRLVDKLE